MIGQTYTTTFAKRVLNVMCKQGFFLKKKQHIFFILLHFFFVADIKLISKPFHIEKLLMKGQRLKPYGGCDLDEKTELFQFDMF